MKTQRLETMIAIVAVAGLSLASMDKAREFALSEAVTRFEALASFAAHVTADPAMSDRAGKPARERQNRDLPRFNFI